MYGIFSGHAFSRQKLLQDDSGNDLGKNQKIAQKVSEATQRFF